MNNDGKILKALETLQAGQTRLEKRLDEHGQVLAHVKTSVEAVAAGQKEMKETMATKADVLSVGVKVDKLKKRIEGIEDHTDMPHPDKN